MTTLSMKKKPVPEPVTKDPGLPVVPTEALKLVKPMTRRQHVREVTNEILLFLEQKYPKCFNRKNPKPLAIGIYKVLIKHESEYSNMAIKRALGLYCSCTRYRKALTLGGDRIDLGGIVKGSVSDEQKRVAIQQTQ